MTATTAASWRDRVKVHPAADLFPPMSDAELAELGKDIKENGLHQPIILYCEKGRRGRRRDLEPDGEIVVLDGVNRLTAMERVGIELFAENGDLAPDIECRDRHEPVKLVFGRSRLDKQKWYEDVEPYSYVASANAHRRHLDREKKRDLVEKLLKATPERSDNATAKIAKVSDKTVAAVRHELEGRSEIPNVATRTDAVGRQQPAAKPPKPPSKEAQVRALREQQAARTGGAASPVGAISDPPAAPPDLDELKQVLRLLSGDPGRAANLPLMKRIALARSVLAFLRLKLDDLHVFGVGL